MCVFRVLVGGGIFYFRRRGEINHFILRVNTDSNSVHFGNPVNKKFVRGMIFVLVFGIFSCCKLQ